MLTRPRKAVHDGLIADAKAHTTQAAHYEAAAKAHDEQAKKDSDKAHSLWEEAAKIEPDHKAPPPAASKVPSPPPAPQPSAAAAAIKG